MTVPVTLRAELRALGHSCRLAKAASDALTKGVVTKPQGRLHTYCFFDWTGLQQPASVIEVIF
jgi:hypothetical protein